MLVGMEVLGFGGGVRVVGEVDVDVDDGWAGLWGMVVELAVNEASSMGVHIAKLSIPIHSPSPSSPPTSSRSATAAQSYS